MNGIDWFRWHHGTTTDRKWPAVAARAKTSVAAVIAVWACLLEAASSHADRGHVHVSDDDAEDLDFALGLEPDTTRRIVAELSRRGMLTDANRIEAWERRQPKREREDDTAADRKRRQRQREQEAKAEGAGNAARDDDGHAETGEDTPCHAMSHQKTPRGEERRVDISTTDTSSGWDAADADARPPEDAEFPAGFEGKRGAPTDPETRQRIAVMGSLRKLGINGATSYTDDLKAYVAAGGTPDHLEQVATFDRCQGKGAIYVLRAATSDLTNRSPLPADAVITAEGRALVVSQPRAGAPPAPKSKTLQAIEAAEEFK